MTIVADVLAQFRADTSSFESGMVRAEGAAANFGREIEAEGERLFRLKEAAGIAATAIGGTFTGALAAGLDMAKNYVKSTEQMQTTMTALLGSRGAADNQVHAVEEFAAKMGIATDSVFGMSKQLEVMTQGQHNTTTEWKAFADEAAALGKNVDQVAYSFGRAYEFMQRSGAAGGGGLATRSLLSEGLIDVNTANKLQQMAKDGASAGAIWEELIKGAQRFSGAGDAAAHTLTGLSKSFHDLLDASVGQAFTPLIKGFEQILQAGNELMGSSGFKTFIADVAKEMDKFGSAIGNVGQKLGGLGSVFTASNLDRFVGDMKSAQSTIGTVIGLVSEFAAEFIGMLPVISRFSGPFLQFLDDGRGGIIGLLASTKEGRDAIVNFVGAMYDLAKSFLGMGGALEPMLNQLSRWAAGLLNVVSGIAGFISHSSSMKAGIELIVGGLAALVVVEKIAAFFSGLAASIRGVSGAIEKYISTFGQSNAAETAAAAATDLHTKSVAGLVAALTELKLAYGQVAFAGGLVNEAQLKNIGLTASDTNMVRELTAAELTNTVSVNTNSTALQANSEEKAVNNVLGRGALGLGAIAGIGATGGIVGSMIGQQVDGTKGSLIGGIGSGVVSGALAGAILGPETGGLSIAIGALAGGLAGAAPALFGLAKHANDAADAMSRIKDVAAKEAAAFDKVYPDSNSDPRKINEKLANASSFVGTEDASRLANATSDLVRGQQALAAANQAIAAAPKQTHTGLLDALAAGLGGLPPDQSNLDSAVKAAKSAQSDINRALSEQTTAQEGIKQHQSDAEKALAPLAGLTNRFVDLVARLTGKSTDQIGTLTADNGINTQLTPGTVAYTDAIAQAIAATKDQTSATDTVARATAGLKAQLDALKDSAEHFKDVMLQISGKSGSQSFVVTREMITQRNGAVLDPSLEQQVGRTLPSQQVLQNQARDITESMKDDAQKARSRDVLIALDNAENAYAQALRNEEKAHYAVTMAVEAQADAIDNLNLARQKYNRDMATMNDANETMTAAMQGHHLLFSNLHAILQNLGPDQWQYVDAIVANVEKTRQLSVENQALNESYKQQQSVVTELTDKLKIQQDVMNKPVAGTGFHNLESDALNEQVHKLQLQKDSLIANGAFSNDPAIQSLDAQIAKLNNIDKLNKDRQVVTIDDPVKKAKDTQAQKTEVPLDDMIKAIQLAGDLQVQLDNAVAAQDKMKPSLDASNEAFRRMNDLTSIQVAGLQAIGSGYQTLQGDVRSLEAADDAVTASAHGLNDAQNAALQSVRATQTAAQAVVKAQEGIVTNTKQIQLDSITSLQAIVAAVAQSVSDIQTSIAADVAKVSNSIAESTANAEKAYEKMRQAAKGPYSNADYAAYTNLDAQVIGADMQIDPSDPKYAAAQAQMALFIRDFKDLLNGGAGIFADASARDAASRQERQGGGSSRLSPQALGGYVNEPVLAGEAGPELILPLTMMDRSAYLLQTYAPGLIDSNYLKASGMKAYANGGVTGGFMAPAASVSGGRVENRSINVADGAVQIEIVVAGDAPANIGSQVRAQVDEAFDELLVKLRSR